jgi:hypothetical protein
MASILPMDELNRLDANIREEFGDGALPNDAVVMKRVEDTLFDFFLFAYAMGNEVTNENLSYDYQPTADEVIETVDAEVAGKTWRNRVEDYFSNGGTGADISRIADTEMHRIANTAALRTAKRAGATAKTWATVLDDRVREYHQYLEGVTIPIDEDFYAWDGTHAPAPGMFGVPEQDINCRCELIFT